jgi:hypothetical protein
VSYLRHCVACNDYDPGQFVPFVLDGAVLGQVHRASLKRLSEFPDLVSVGTGSVTLPASASDFWSRSAILDRLADRLIAAGDIREKQNELYAVSASFNAAPVCALDRKLVPLFGIKAYGVHLNGFVRTAAGIELWIGKRARDKAVAPGKLDNLVAGGQPMGLSAIDNLVKECAEEADIPDALARSSVPVGAITYRMMMERGLRDDVLFVYDLALGEDFVPRNTDGEIESFERWPLARVAERVRDTDDFKFNVALVIIDFLIRHGAIAPDHPDYLALVKGLHG